MQTTQNSANHHEYRSIPVTALVESASNPRKRFDETSLNELAASLKTQGVLAPLLVREAEENKYEVIAGARRLRAAKLAELPSIPVRVVKLTDAEAIEAQCVENLQREDIHPMEEALGFKSLLELGQPYTVAHVAARAGKSEAYVYGRLKLTDLIPTVAEAFLKDQITIGHALLIAKLPTSQQQESFAAAFRSMWTSEGNTHVMIPVRELAIWIETNVLLQLVAAPFDKQDEGLVHDAGSCTNCPKRTGFNKLLFSDVRKDSCTDPQCFRAKSALANALRESTIVVLFICSGGRLDSHPISETAIGLVSQLMDRGCGTVIASPWPLDTRVPSHWLPAFLEEWEAGKSVIDATFSANEYVSRQMGDSPAVALAMNVFGDPLRKKRKT